MAKKKIKKEVVRSNKQHMRLRKAARSNQERTYHLACCMSQVEMNRLLTRKEKRTLWEANR